jgi:hypothetical protein
MSRTLLQSFLAGIVSLAAITSCIAQSPAADKPADQPADKYNVTGSVLSTISEHGHFYQVSTDARIYLLMCAKTGTLHLGQPECKFAGKPIASGDTVHFRIDGDWACMPPITEGTEEKLRILTTELKVIPPLPTAAPATDAPAPPASTKAKDKDKAPSPPEPGVVIGTGLHVKGQHGVGWSTAPTFASAPLAPAPGITTASAATPVMATGPVMAVPVTGGAPVLVTPTGPVTGGVVTGIPVTGGAPVTAIATAPVMGVPVAGPPHAAPGQPLMIGGGSAPPQWVHVLRIQTAGKIYQLECSTKPCTVADKEIALGDPLTLRIDKKNHAYLSSGPPNSSPEEEYKILSVTESGSAPDPKQPESKQPDSK